MQSEGEAVHATQMRLLLAICVLVLGLRGLLEVELSNSLSGISVVVPCYNSSASLSELLDRMVATLESMNADFEVILVNDCSPDNTWEIIENRCAADPRIRGIDLQFNVGQFQATICGFEHLNNALVVTIDDDLQHAPEDLPTLVSALEQNPDVDCVVGSFAVPKQNILRRFGTQFKDIVIEFLYGKPRGLKMSAYRVMRRSTSDAICAHKTIKPLLLATLLKSARKIINVEVPHYSRQHGKSGYSFLRLASILWTATVFGSTLPLRIVGMLGGISLVVSMILSIYYLVRYFAGGGVPGFATTVLLLLFFGGTTLFALGIIGEYIARVVQEVARTPRYFVRTMTFSERVESDTVLTGD